jgi:hypothetical protein
MTMHNNQVNPITAIQNHFDGMNPIDKMKFLQETGLNFANINIMDYNSAMKLCKRLNLDLSDVSLFKPKSYADALFESRMDRIDKHNEESEKLIERYKALEKQYYAAKEKREQKRSEIYSKNGVTSELAFKDLKRAGGISSIDADALAMQDKDVQDAELAYDVALSIANDHTHDIV